jgi:ketosteroid isomerase-like protein
MSKTAIQSRRQFFSAAALSAGALAASRPATAAQPAGGMTRERYMEYVGLFNANDPGFLKFYHDDVVLELRNQELRGAKAIRDFYAEVKTYIKETVQVTHYIADATGIAAELPSEFKVFKDWDSPYFGRKLKAGEVFRTISFGLYWVEDGRFRQIKAARYKLVNDWRMEA